MIYTFCGGQVGVLYHFFSYFFDIIFSNISISAIFFSFLFFSGQLHYTYVATTYERQATEILYFLVAIHDSNGRLGHMGLWEWEWETGMGNGNFGKMGYMDGTVLQAVDRSGIFHCFHFFFSQSK